MTHWLRWGDSDVVLSIQEGTENWLNIDEDGRPFIDATNGLLCFDVDGSFVIVKNISGANNWVLFRPGQELVDLKRRTVVKVLQSGDSIVQGGQDPSFVLEYIYQDVAAALESQQSNNMQVEAIVDSPTSIQNNSNDDNNNASLDDSSATASEDDFENQQQQQQKQHEQEESPTTHSLSRPSKATIAPNSTKEDDESDIDLEEDHDEPRIATQLVDRPAQPPTGQNNNDSQQQTTTSPLETLPLAALERPQQPAIDSQLTTTEDTQQDAQIKSMDLGEDDSSTTDSEVELNVQQGLLTQPESATTVAEPLQSGSQQPNQASKANNTSAKVDSNFEETDQTEPLPSIQTPIKKATNPSIDDDDDSDVASPNLLDSPTPTKKPAKQTDLGPYLNQSLDAQEICMDDYPSPECDMEANQPPPDHSTDNHKPLESSNATDNHTPTRPESVNLVENRTESPPAPVQETVMEKRNESPQIAPVETFNAKASPEQRAAKEIDAESSRVGVDAGDEGASQPVDSTVNKQAEAKLGSKKVSPLPPRDETKDRSEIDKAPTRKQDADASPSETTGDEISDAAVPKNNSGTVQGASTDPEASSEPQAVAEPGTVGNPFASEAPTAETPTSVVPKESAVTPKVASKESADTPTNVVPTDPTETPNVDTKESTDTPKTRDYQNEPDEAPKLDSKELSETPNRPAEKSELDAGALKEEAEEEILDNGDYFANSNDKPLRSPTPESKKELPRSIEAPPPDDSEASPSNSAENPVEPESPAAPPQQQATKDTLEVVQEDEGKESPEKEVEAQSPKQTRSKRKQGDASEQECAPEAEQDQRPRRTGRKKPKQKDEPVQEGASGTLSPNLPPIAPRARRKQKLETPNTTSTTKRQRRTPRTPVTVQQTNTGSDIRILVTGLELTDEHLDMVKSLKGEIVEKVELAHTATHIIASNGTASLRRTPKLMIGLNFTPNIVSLSWLEMSAKAKKALAPTKQHLILSDEEAEEKYDFSMRQTLKTVKKRLKENDKLLGGWSVFVCKRVAGNKAPSTKELQLIVEAAGAIWLTSLKNHLDNENTIIVTSDPEKKSQLTKAINTATDAGAKKRTTSWLFKALLTQETDL